jgi:hypothetical protein
MSVSHGRRLSSRLRGGWSFAILVDDSFTPPFLPKNHYGSGFGAIAQVESFLPSKPHLRTLATNAAHERHGSMDSGPMWAGTWEAF